MSTPTARTNRTRSGTARTPRRPTPAETAAARATAAEAKAAQADAQQAEAEQTAEGHDRHTITVTIPLDRAARAAGKVAALPLTAARRILPAKGGLPLYLGLGVLGAVGILEWPVVAGIGIGYAILRRGGPLSPAPVRQEPASDPQAPTA
ncbi:hypothetical protein [Peterkaempfera bronchialis]|uniref:hypothetical protein n=1 Tax=Peterkaempfera bronchialis TaxID=2126346 RepID=UPI003C30C0EE